MTLESLNRILDLIYFYGWEDHLNGKPFNPSGRVRDIAGDVLECFEGEDKDEKENSSALRAHGS